MADADRLPRRPGRRPHRLCVPARRSVGRDRHHLCHPADRAGFSAPAIHAGHPFALLGAGRRNFGDGRGALAQAHRPSDPRLHGHRVVDRGRGQPGGGEPAASRRGRGSRGSGHAARAIGRPRQRDRQDGHRAGVGHRRLRQHHPQQPGRSDGIEQRDPVGDVLRSVLRHRAAAHRYSGEPDAAARL